MQPLDAVPVEAPLIQYLRILPNADTLLFRKVDSFFGPSSTWTVTDACRPLTQDCPPLLIESTTRHYNSTGMHSTSFLIAFPVSVQQGRALERTSKALKGMSMHCHAHAYGKYTGSLQSRGHLFAQDTLDGTNGRGSTVHWNFSNSAERLPLNDDT